MDLRQIRRGATYRVPICLALIALWCSAIAGRAMGADQAESVTVPLIPRGVHLFVEGTVEGQSLLFALDTGAGADILTPEAAKRVGLKLEKGQGNVLGAGGNAAAPAAVKIGKLTVGTTALTDQNALVIPLPDALECDGLLGTPFFQRWVVQIDYAKLQMTLTPRAAFQPPTNATAIPIRINNGIPELEGTVDGIKGYFKIDTGAGNALTLFRPFIEQNHLRGKYKPALETITGRGVGGLLYGEMARVPTFSIASFPFTGIATDLSQQKTGAFASDQSAGNLGGEVWRRFTLTLDYAGQQIYLTRNTRYDEPFIGNRSGLALDSDQGVFVVRAVIPKGPADEAGVQDGDAVLAINGAPAKELKAWEIRAIFRGDPGVQVRLRLRGMNKRVRETTLTLRDLF